MHPIKPLALMATSALTGLLAMAPALRAAAALKEGTVKKFEVSIATLPRSSRQDLAKLVVRNTGNGWRATNGKFVVRLNIKVVGGRYTDIVSVRGRVHATTQSHQLVYRAASRDYRRVRINGARIATNGNSLGEVTRRAERWCRTNGPRSQGRKVSEQPVTIQFSIAHRRHVTGTTARVARVKYILVCENTAPQRDRSVFKVTRVRLSFDVAKRNACPKQVAMQIKASATAKGDARFRIMRSDGREVLRSTLTFTHKQGGFQAVYLKASTVRQTHRYRYRVEVLSNGQRTATRWVPLRVFCTGNPGRRVKG